MSGRDLTEIVNQLAMYEVYPDTLVGVPGIVLASHRQLDSATGKPESIFDLDFQELVGSDEPSGHKVTSCA